MHFLTSSILWPSSFSFSKSSVCRLSADHHNQKLKCPNFGQKCCFPKTFQRQVNFTEVESKKQRKKATIHDHKTYLWKQRPVFSCKVDTVLQDSLELLRGVRSTPGNVWPEVAFTHHEENLKQSQCHIYQHINTT